MNRPGTATARRAGPARRAASAGSAERFAARVRSRRRRRFAVVLASLALLVAGVWLAVLSPYLVLQEVQVRGTVRVPQAEVRMVAETELGRPMVLLDPSDVAREVAALPLVRSVQVRRSWPATLTVTVTERLPVAAVAAGPDYRLVDREGVEVETVSRRPSDVPVLDVDLAGGPGSVATLAAALDVLDGLPPSLHAQVVEIGATSPDGVWLRLDASADTSIRVVWGDSSQGQQKAGVLQVLMAAQDTRDAASYDVSAPLNPAVRPR